MNRWDAQEVLGFVAAMTSPRAQRFPVARGEWEEQRGDQMCLCPMASACIAVQQRPYQWRKRKDWKSRVLRQFPVLGRVRIPVQDVPAALFPAGFSALLGLTHIPLWLCIQELNDRARWSRQRIATWLQQRATVAA